MAEVILTAGLGYGDEGKGTTVDFLAREKPSLVVRYNGGAQAAHNVVDNSLHGLTRYGHHTFSQYGSGTFAGARTFLSRFMMVNPIFMHSEMMHLHSIGADIDDCLVIEEDALITTPFHVSANRIREMSRSSRHGSCGMGIGETAEDALLHPDDAIRAKDLKNLGVMRRKLKLVQERMAAKCFGLKIQSGDPNNEWEFLNEPVGMNHMAEQLVRLGSRLNLVDAGWLKKAIKGSERVIFEGAQGVLLDEWAGWHPHTTWSTTTFKNAFELLEGIDAKVTRLGILRAYATRHGAGPFVTEDDRFTSLSEHDHNKQHAWQGSFRSGMLDLVSARYAIRVLGGIDGLVITNLDRLDLLQMDRIPVCNEYVRATACGMIGPNFTPPLNGTDLVKQEETTRQLFACNPVENTLPLGSYAQEVARYLAVPLALTSRGATAAEKARP